MANRILKGLAIAAGTGLAMGFTSGRARGRVVRIQPPAPSSLPPVADTDAAFLHESDLTDDFLNIEPLLDRMERVEARIELIERRPASHVPDAGQTDWSGFAELVADLDERVQQNSRELDLLRDRVQDAERRAAESANSLERKLQQARDEIPALVESAVAGRFESLQSRFDSQLELAHQKTLESFERAIDDRISSRIGLIEKALADQAGSIEGLRVRATETDNNLQRLVTAIEKLCERAQLIAPVPESQMNRSILQRPPQPESRLPFESQLHDAMTREPVVPKLRTEEPVVEVQVAAPAFTGGDAPAPKKSRFLFRNLIVAGFSFLAARLIR